MSLKFLPVMIGLGAALGLHDWSPRTPAPSDLSLFARELQPHVGRSFGPMTLRSVQAESNELVLTLDGAAGWRAGLARDGMNAFFLRGFCRGPVADSYFAEGRTMRLDTLEAGAHRLRGTPVTRCPQA